MTQPDTGPHTGGRPGPCLDDPTGLRYDRGDVEETSTKAAGDGWAINGRGAASEPAAVPVDEPQQGGTVHSLPPFNLRELAARHITAADWDRIERGAA